MKYREIRTILKQDGWYRVHQVGSHEQFKHPVKVGRVTVAGKDGADIPIGTEKAIFKQASLR